MLVARWAYITKNKECGFGIIDSIIALAILSSILGGIAFFNSLNNKRKDARILADQTNVYAEEFARYMKRHYLDLEKQATDSAIVITVQTLIDNHEWPDNLSTQNMYQQRPCVTVARNSSSGNLEAMMYFVGDNSNNSTQRIEIVRNAAIILGGKGGIYVNGSIKGNSGWNIVSGSVFLNTAMQCGANIENNSLAINLDLLFDWNQNLQPEMSILRGMDKDVQGSLQRLPGHMQNANTLKANLYISQNNGVILDSTTQAKLSIEDNNNGTGIPTLGFGRNTLSTIIGDTIQPSTLAKAGQVCTADEVGKVVVDQGLNGPGNQILARGTLVCTVNAMLCGVPHTCYLPSITNSIIFQNNTIGIQDTNGSFVCPSSVPFASNPKYSSSTNGYYYSTSFGAIIGCEYAINTDGGCIRPSQYTKACPLPFVYTNGCGGYHGSEIRSFGNYGVTGGTVAMDFKNIDGAVNLLPISGILSAYKTVIGYTVSSSDMNLNCSNVCLQLPTTQYSSWVAASSYPTFNNSFLGQNSCGCLNWDKSHIVMGLAIVILQKPQAILNSVQCSNSAEYTN